MALSTEALYEKALDLSGNVDDNFLDLAKSLRQLLDRDADLYRRVMDKSNLGSRKAYYLVNIDKWFGAVQAKVRLKNIGWTKLQIIGPHVTPHNLEELLELAENNSAAQLKSLMKGETPLNNSHCVLMYFSPTQYDELEAVLLANGGTKQGRGVLNKEEALLRALRKLPSGKAK